VKKGENVATAVILASAQGARLRGLTGGTPKGFLRLGGRPIAHWSVQKMFAAGIEQVVIVTGYGADAYEVMCETWTGVLTVTNPVHADSGSMYSLYCAREMVEGPFLLAESDVIYETRALEALLEDPAENAVLVAEPSSSGDDRYVEVHEGKAKRIGPAEGGEEAQFTGLSKISPPMFAAMLKYADSFFRERFYYLDYEECISRIAGEVAVHACKADDLLWAKVDCDERLARATNRIFPLIFSRDGGPPDGAPT
jgi:2-aminoethylphosphonate-pyruvate transaminase